MHPQLGLRTCHHFSIKRFVVKWRNMHTRVHIPEQIYDPDIAKLVRVLVINMSDGLVFRVMKPLHVDPLVSLLSFDFGQKEEPKFFT